MHWLLFWSLASPLNPGPIQAALAMPWFWDGRGRPEHEQNLQILLLLICSRRIYGMFSCRTIWLRWAQNKEGQTSMCITYSSTKPPDHPPAFGASSFSLRITLSSHKHLPCTPNSSQLCSSAQETNGLIRSLNWYLEFQPSDLPKIALTPPCVLCNTVTSAHSQVPRLTCFLNPASAL